MTTPTAPAAIPDHTSPMPDPSDRDTFTTRGLALFNWERFTLVPSINALAQGAYENATAAYEAAAEAEAVVGVEMWVAATSYATGDVAISPTDYQSYRRKAPGGVDATDPAASANWVRIGGAAELQKAGDTMDGPLTIGASSDIRADRMRYAPIYKHTIFMSPGANQATFVGAKPNGTSTTSGFYACNSSPNEVGGFSVSTDAMRLFTDRDTTGGTSILPIKISFDGVDKITFLQTGVIDPYGIKGRQGTSGTASSNAVNLYWTGTALEVWVDTTRIGTVNITP